MHTIGFFHEDSRPDRDKHVDTEGEKQRVTYVNTVGEYDICSLMHSVGLELVPKKCKSWDCTDCPDCYNCIVSDVRRNVTELDVQKINLYYDCNKIGIHYTLYSLIVIVTDADILNFLVENLLYLAHRPIHATNLSITRDKTRIKTSTYRLK